MTNRIRIHFLWILSGIIISIFPQIVISASLFTDGSVTGVEGIANFGSHPSQVFPISSPSLEDKMASLQNQQQYLKSQLADIEKQIAALQQFSTAQKSLNLKWVDASKGQTIANALNVNLGNGKKIQICHAQFQHGTHPGTLVDGGCMITYGGDSLIIPNYQVLSGNTSTQWSATNNIDQYQTIEQNQNIALWEQKSIPIQGGFENGEPLFVCNAMFDHQMFIGKVISNQCNIAAGSKEIRVKDYQVLFGNR